MCTNENENEQLDDKNFNQKFLVNGGVVVYFGNVFAEVGEGKLPIIKHKLRKILVDFGLCQTCMEISQDLGYIKIWYQDLQAIELRGILLQRFNQAKESQAIELVISFEGNSCSPPKITRGIKTYTGLTKLIYQEFISETESRSLADDDPYNQIREVIKQGNLSLSQPLESIFRGELD